VNSYTFSSTIKKKNNLKKRKAAIAMARNEQQRKAPVIDLFFEKKSDALHYAKNNPAYQWVEVHP
jgi:hypothetical protein